MKNLLPILDKIIDSPNKCKEKKDYWGKWKSWSAYLGKVAFVNPENLLGEYHDNIVSKYLHTLPEEYRDLGHLYSYLNISTITKDEVFNSPLYGRRENTWYGKRSYYYFNDKGILCVKRKPKIRPKSSLTKAERMRKFYEEKKAKNKRYREVDAHNEQYYSELLQRTEHKRKEKEEKINLQKIISHGFDPLTSFRPEYKPKI